MSEVDQIYDEILKAIEREYVYDKESPDRITHPLLDLASYVRALKAQHVAAQSDDELSYTKKQMHDALDEAMRHQRRAKEWHMAALYWYHKATGEVAPMDFSAAIPTPQEREK